VGILQSGVASNQTIHVFVGSANKQYDTHKPRPDGCRPYDPTSRPLPRSQRRLRSAERGTLADVTELRVIIPDDVAERLATEAAERGTSAEDLAADLLRRHLPVPAERSLSVIGMFDGVPGAIGVAEMERRLEDGEDDEFAR
jgi:hypothetical protein